MLKVLHIDTGREWRGGQQQVFYLSRELSARGHTSVIITPKGSPLAERARGAGLDLREISYHGAGDPIAIHQLVQLITEIQPKLLHVHTANAHSLAFLALHIPGLSKERKPFLIVHRRVDFAPGSDILTRIRYAAEPVLFIAISEAVGRVLEEHGVPRDRLRIVHSCVDTARIDAHSGESVADLRSEIGIPPGADLIGAVGALVPHKGHKHLLAAMPRILSQRPDARLVIFGDGPLESELRRECWNLDIQKHVLFLGFRGDVARFLHAFDVFAHPSIEEGMGTSILDAMAARLPVVASRTGGITEIVRHGTTGWLVPPASPSELAGAIMSLLDDPRRRREFGEAGRKLVESQFSVENLGDRVLDVYAEALGITAPSHGAGPA
jgi:L-malate glycosyltransferase